MRIRVVATSTRKSEDGSFEWGVDLYVGGDKLTAGLAIHNPLNEEQQSLCRWYLDKFRQREPFSTSKAKSAASLLEAYGSDLAKQLHLSDHVPSDGDVLVCIEDAFDTAPGTSPSIHQLYWEFLEDRKIWDSPVKVTVQRVVQRDGGNSVSGSNEVKLLLVTARDLTREWTSDSDINPSLVSDILWNIKSTLDSSTSAIHLSIEIVRPGTFDALEDQLKRRRKSDLKPFDIIHFDLHGTVKRPKGRAASGFLHFNDPESDETIPVLAEKVAQLVAQHSVPTVIFNACNSANARYGDESNIAKTFVQRGVNQVLAMAHTASESATFKFLETFYSEFLVTRTGFIKAARHARSVLRSDPLRSARFHTRVAVIDWVIPVLYCLSDDNDDDDQSDAVPSTKHRAPSALKTITAPPSPQTIYGRDFDYLRLERLLLPDGLAFLYGAPGVGKTVFLRQLAYSWTRSSFITHVIFIELRSSMITSVSDFVEEALRQLGAALESEPSLDALRRALSRKRTAFILDGFGDTPDTEVPDTSCMSTALSAFIKSSRDLSIKANNDVDTYFLVSGRTESAHKALDIRAGEIPSYELRGLSRADSMCILQSINPDSSTLASHRDHDDHSEMLKAESLIHLLQGNPTGLIHFGRLALRSDMSYSKMYNILHGEDPVLCLDVNLLKEDFTLFEEFMSMLSSLSDGCLATWTVLSWYWHSGPVASDLATILMDARIVSHKDAVTDALQMAGKLGFIEQEPDGRVTWIHSLLTIFTRISTCSSACRVQLLEGGGTWLGFQRDFASDVMNNLLPNGQEFFDWPMTNPSGLPYAVQLLKSALSAYWSRDAYEQYWRFLISFLADLDKSCKRLFQNFLSDTKVYNDVADKSDVLRDNFFWAIKLCRGRGPLPIPAVGWPTELIFDMGHFILKRHSSEDVSYICSYYENMLNGTIVQSKLMGGGGKAVKPGDLPNILRLLGVLTETHRQHIPRTTSRTEEFMKMGKKVIRESESAFGVSSDPFVVMNKAALSFANATALIDERDSDQSRAELKMGMDLLGQLHESSNSVAASKFAELLGRKDHKEAAIVRAAMDEYADRSSGTGGKIEEFFNIAMAEAKGQNINDMRTSQPGVSSQGHPAVQMWDMLLRNYKTLAGPTHRGRLHEAELDRGHWARAMGHHSGLVVDSLMKLDFAEAQEHVDVQEAIARKHGVYDQHEQQIQDSREVLNHAETLLSLPNFESITEQHVIDFEKFWTNFKPAKIGAGVAPWIQKIAKINTKNWARDHDDGLAHNHAPGILSLGVSSKDGLMSQLAKHGRQCANSTEYTNKVLGGIHKVLETLQRLELAEDESDAEAIFRLLDEFREIAKEEFCRELVNAKDINARADWNTTRLLVDISAKLKTSTGNDGESLDAYSEVLERCRTVFNLGRCPETEELKGIAGRIEPLCQALHMARLVRDAYAALRIHGDKKTFLKLAKDMLKLHEQGKFAQALATEENRVVLHELWMEYFRASMTTAADDRRWVEAAKVFTAWRAQKEVWTMTSNHDAFEGVLQQEFVCLAFVQMLEFLAALERFDLPMVGVALDRMRRHSAQWEKNFPGQKNAMTGDLKACEKVVSLTMRRLAESGPAAAHAFAKEAAYVVRSNGTL